MFNFGSLVSIDCFSFDPQFVSTDESNANYLQLNGSNYPYSPCIDTGSNEGAPSTDYSGAPRAASNMDPADIGAYEFQSGTRTIRNVDKNKYYLTFFAALNDADQGNTITVANSIHYEPIVNWPNVQDITLMNANSSTWETVIINVKNLGIRAVDLSNISSTLRGTIEGITIFGGNVTGNGGGVLTPAEFCLCHQELLDPV